MRKQITNIPLQERVVIISEKAIKLFGRTVLKFIPPFANWTPIAFAGGVAGGAIGANSAHHEQEMNPVIV